MNSFSTTFRLSHAATLLLLLFQLHSCGCVKLAGFRRFDVFPKSNVPELGHRALVGYGHYAETPETCPATTTCPLICVNDTSACPTQCPDGYNLCIDGSCSSEPCDESLLAPCLCETMYASCPWIVDYYDECKLNFEDFYDEYNYCLEVQDEALPKVSFSSFWFLVCYFWIAGVTLLVAGWCAMNPTGIQSETLIPASYRGSSDFATHASDTEQWTQAGYKDHWFGSIILILVWFTLIGIQVLLLILTLFYYMQQESIVRWYPVFEDDVQVLLAFIMAWNVGFIWTFMFQWPVSIASLFRRRCSLNQATHVTVIAPVKEVSTIGNKRKPCFARLVDLLWFPLLESTRRFFSAPKTLPGFETILCKVDKASGSFYCRMGRYVYSESDGKFVPGSMDVGKSIGDFYQLRSGLSTADAQLNLNIVGPNIIMLEKPSLLNCLWNEFSKAFYVYQTFIVWTWFNYWYYHMALIATAVRLMGGTMTAVFQFMNDSILYQLTKAEGTVEVLRNDTRIEIPVTEVVPGDIVVLRPGVVHCDLVVLESEHLLVDESALTGESNPVMKSAFEKNTKAVQYDELKHKQHTIFAGTTIMESGDRSNDVGLVVATGSFTKKGQLLGDILSYKRNNFLFDHEVPVVVLILVFEMLALVALVFYFLGEQPVYAWFYGMFVVATVIPPLLPTVFVISVGVSSSRLQKKRISCTQPQALLVAGKVNVCCFDKTGTLTESGMNVSGIDCGGNAELTNFTMLGMAVCHNLKVTATEDIVGHEVDKAMFRSSGASLAYQKGSDIEIKYLGNSYTILQQYTFDHKTATQSVIIESEGIKRVFVKGSPETIRSLCLSDSVPSTFLENLNSSSKSGMYILAIATKELNLNKQHSSDSSGEYESAYRDVSSLSREEVESSLTFCGFIKFENRIKEETQSVMQHLTEANVLLTMITGDNVLTGIRVAREAGICLASNIILGEISTEKTVDWYNLDTNEVVDDPLSLTDNVDIALTGEAWSTLVQENPELAYSLVRHVRVFGRCNPTHKISVVTRLVEVGYITLMCGDGQNDCGALRAAHIGVALSNAEASIVAPFTSLDKTLSSVTDVLLEGRCSLSSALKVYSYYILYGQLCSILQVCNSYFASTFSDWSWVFLDAIWPISLALTLPLAKATNRLSMNVPTASLFGVRTLSSICGLLFWNIVFLVITMFLLFGQEWFLCRMWTYEDVSAVYNLGDNYETTVMFIVGGYQFVATAVALNYGYTWRAPWYKNNWFNFFALLWTVFQYVMTLYPSKFSCIWRVNCTNENVVLGFGEMYPINNPFNTTVLPVEFRWTLVIVMILNQITLCAWEYLFVNGYLYKRYTFHETFTSARVAEVSIHLSSSKTVGEES